SAGNELPSTVGALHNWIYELYDSPGWFAFQALYHEAMGLHPRRKKGGKVDDIVNSTQFYRFVCNDASIGRVIGRGSPAVLMPVPTRAAPPSRQTSADTRDRSTHVCGHRCRTYW